jgi:hypothetical protein
MLEAMEHILKQENGKERHLKEVNALRTKNKINLRES